MSRHGRPSRCSRSWWPSSAVATSGRSRACARGARPCGPPAPRSWTTSCPCSRAGVWCCGFASWRSSSSAVTSACCAGSRRCFGAQAQCRGSSSRSSSAPSAWRRRSRSRRRAAGRPRPRRSVTRSPPRPGRCWSTTRAPVSGRIPRSSIASGSRHAGCVPSSASRGRCSIARGPSRCGPSSGGWAARSDRHATSTCSRTASRPPSLRSTRIGMPPPGSSKGSARSGRRHDGRWSKRSRAIATSRSSIVSSTWVRR